MNKFQEKLKKTMDEFVHFVYRVTRNFPREELFGTTSQIRRAALSIILNYIEGFARRRKAVQLNFLEMSYGSLKETKYLLYFSFKENYLSKKDYEEGLRLAEEIGAMLWSELSSLDKKLKK